MNKTNALLIILLGLLAVALVVVNQAKATQLKVLHAECDINASEKECEENLVCTPFNEQSGNYKCEYPEVSPSPTAAPTEGPEPTDEPEETPVPSESPTPSATPTVTPEPHHDDGGDGLGCAVNDCSGNLVRAQQDREQPVVPAGPPDTGRAQ